MDARLVSNLELAERDARKALRVGPVLAADQPIDDVDAVQMEIGAEKSVEKENLPDGVGQVEHLDGEVRGDQVVAVEPAANEAADLGDEVLDANHASGLMLALRQQIAVHLVDDVAHGLLADLQVRRSAADARRVHDRGQVDAGALVEEAPEQRRRGGQHCLEQEYERHPLVVANKRRAAMGVPLSHHHRRVTGNPAAHTARPRADTGRGTARRNDGEPVGGDGLLDGQVVGVADPTDGIGIVAVAVGELRRTPARDWSADELLRADEERETDQHHDRVLASQPINVVVIGR